MLQNLTATTHTLLLQPSNHIFTAALYQSNVDTTSHSGRLAHPQPLLKLWFLV